MNNDPLCHVMALACTPGLSPSTAKKLVDYFGDAQTVCQASKSDLRQTGLKEAVVQAIGQKSVYERVENEQSFMAKHRIGVLCYLDADFPYRLKQCEDAPLLIFYKGKPCFNRSCMLSVVGTRKATGYGREVCEEIMASLPHEGDCAPVIVSGMAYGIDICAHRAALKNGLYTIGVLGHGLHTMYPASHRSTALEMLEQGALVTEFDTQFPVLPLNFVRRNRIIAGLSDATLVVESPTKGGSLITADLANSYNREVFAVPGRVNDERSSGCLWLIQTQRAHLVTGAADICTLMNWNQYTLFSGPAPRPRAEPCSIEEQSVVQFLANHEGMASFDVMQHEMTFPVEGTLAMTLLQLEIKGRIQTLPGRIYKLCER